MAERTVFLRLGMKISDLQSQARAARAAIDDFSKKAVSAVERNSASIDDLSNRIGGVGLALTGLATIAVQRFAEFDKAMSSVSAATHATGEELRALREAAIQAGADTSFSASEAAGAIEELAKAGVSTADILSGGLDGALALAAAGGVEVAEAAETAASALTQFDLKGSDVAHVADLLAAGAGKAQGGVTDLGQALNQSGLIASQTGLSIEETTAALASFASAGLLGSDAGTSFKTMLQVLSAPSSTAEKEMRRLGISAYDAQGSFVGLEALAGNLQTALKDLTPQQRNSALATIFGSDAVRAASIVYQQGAAGVRQWTDAVDDQGYAADTARRQTDNLIGDLERLGGSLDTAFIRSGSAANTALRGIVQGAEAAVDAIGGMSEPVLNVTTLIAGGGGLALLGVAGLGKLAVSAAEARTAMATLGVSTRAATLAASGLGAALAVGAIAFVNWAQEAAEAKARTEAFQATLGEFGKTTERTIFAINERLSEDQRNWADRLFGEDEAESLIDRAERVGVAVEDLQGYILGNEEAVQKVTKATRDYISAQDEELGTADIRARAGRFLTDALDDEANALTDAQKAAVQKKLADEAAGVSADELATASQGAAGATSNLTQAMQDAIGPGADLTEVITEQWNAAVKAAGGVLSLRDAQRQAEAAFDDARRALKDNGQTLDTNTAKGRANQAALDAIASTGWDLVDSMQASGASSSDLAGTMARTRERFIQTAESMGMSKREARELADQLGLIPKNVRAAVTVEASGALSTIATIDNSLRRLDGKTVTAAVVMRRLGQVEMATGGRLPGFPTGGRLPGNPPADPMRDNLIGVDGAGMPRVRVRSREWVVNERAADFYGDRLMGAINSQAIPREVLAGLAGLASGGSVATAGADARERRERLREYAAELSTSLRRGDLRDQVTGGLSGAYGALDQLRDLANSGDLTSGGAQRLRQVASRGEWSLRSLYKDANRAEKQLERTRDRLEELQQIQSGVQSSIVGGFRLSDVRGEFDPATGKRVASASSLASAAREYATKAKKFGGLLEKLRKKSGSAAIVQEIAGYGVEEGTPLAQSLLADLPSLKSLAGSLDDIERYGARAGAVVAHAVGGQSLSEAQRAVRPAEANVRAIDKKMNGWAKKIGAETAKALGIQPRAAGGPMRPGGAYITGEVGPELVLPQRPGYVLSADATRRLAMSGYGASAGSVSTSYSDHLTVNNYGQPLTDDRLRRFGQKQKMLRGRPR